MKTVTVFGSAKCPPASQDYALAEALGRCIGAQGLNLCNGGYSGTMEASAKGAREGGVETFGITLKQFAFPANRYITQEIRAESYWERLQHLFARGDAFVALKGGTGTLVELALVAEMMLKDFDEPKPILILESFWSPVIEALREEIDAPDPRFRDLGPSKLDRIFTPFNSVADFESKLKNLLNQK